MAAMQHGVVGRWQLLSAGFSAGVIRGLVRRGHLHPVHRGVYAVGHRRLTRKGRWMAAVLAGGPDAVLSHRAAVELWELRPGSSGRIDVTVPGRTRRGQRGIRVHNVRRLHPDDRDVVDGIPVTSVHRALLDYAEIARHQQLRLGIEAAERREIFDLRQLEALYARARGRRGVKALKAVVAELRGPAPWTQSELERRFLALLREHGFPEPATNVLIHGFLADCWWPEARLVVEIDGYEFHKSRKQFEENRLRDTKLQLEGIRVLRVTQARIEFGTAELLSDLRRALPASAA
ncbi:MAG TPA: type IV toxin-antitoxin system AbiEi family antitoxin domain-containing protein [Solirubrobacteraceae bacterium]|nr:type IV toxin-antitoxin system AbiEi family antitoxin domain-containing protein [Solirubrobacteraceae bacterium]